MDFEPWLRDQLARGDAPLPAATSSKLARRLGTRFRIPGFRLGLAVGAFGMIAIGLASGRALPVLQLTSPAPRAQELPVATWGGVPSEPPGAARLASDQGPGGPGSGRGGPGGTPPAGAGDRRSPVGSSSGTHPEDSDKGPGSGSAVPTPMPVDDHGGTPAGGSPAPRPTATATAPDDHGGRSPDPNSADSRRGHQPDPTPSPTPGQ